MAAAEESRAPSQYDQEEKKECREKLIEHTVRALTTERSTSACVLRDHVRTAWQQSRETSPFNDEEVAEIEEDIDRWELLHDSKVQTKKPSDLRVCYLAGDNPLNDYNVFLENGVLPQNMWAVEKDGQTLKKALENMKQSENAPQIFKGNFLDLVRDFTGQFDIIYFDACGSLPSVKQKTLKAIGYVFLKDKLTSPGALITTFSFPPKKAEEAAASNTTPQDTERTNLLKLSREYLKFRYVNTSRSIEPHNKIPQFNEKFLNGRSDEDNYSDYIIHQIIDTAYMYIPAYRMISSKRNSLLEQSFVNKGDIKKAIEKLLPRLELDSEESQLLLDELKELESSIGDIVKNLSLVKSKNYEMYKKMGMMELNIKNMELQLVFQSIVLGPSDEKEKKLFYLRHELKQLYLELEQLNEQIESMLSQLQEKKQDNIMKMQDLADHESKPQRILGQLGHSLQNSDNPLCKTWCSEVFPDWKSDDLKKWEISLLLMVHLLTNWIVFIDKCSNEGFQACLGTILNSLGGEGDESIFSQFVDVPNEEVTTQMIATLLYGQMARPSFPVVGIKLERLHYTAKTRQMFSNVFIFDRCRYVYDQFPSVYTANSAAKPHKQMVFRLAVDGLRKHLRHICEEDVFKYCNVVEQGEQERVTVIPESTEITTESTSNDDHSHNHKKLKVDQIPTI